MSERCLPSQLIEAAALLVGAVHDEGPREVDSILAGRSKTDLRNLCVVLAAMVPADYSPGELLAWNDAQHWKAPTPIHGPRVVRPHGTHAAFNRHRAHNEDPCEACWLGERRYQRERQRSTASTADTQPRPHGPRSVETGRFSA